VSWINRRRAVALGIVLLVLLALVVLTTVPVSHVWAGEVMTLPTTNDPDWRVASIGVDVPGSAAVAFAWHTANGSLVWYTLVVFSPPNVPSPLTDCTGGPVAHATCSFNAEISGTYSFQFSFYDSESVHNQPAGPVAVDYSGSFTKPLLGPGYAY
jgi:hypothetical protein